jgi:hypothetical protein
LPTAEAAPGNQTGGRFEICARHAQFVARVVPEPLAESPPGAILLTMSGAGSGGVELVIERDRAAPGDAICGSVTPGPQVWAVDLVRVESSPASTLEFTVASVQPGSDGTFAVPVPADAPPSVAGRACSLVWRVRARTSELPRMSDPRRTLEIACRP